MLQFPAYFEFQFLKISNGSFLRLYDFYKKLDSTTNAFCCIELGTLEYWHGWILHVDFLARDVPFFAYRKSDCSALRCEWRYCKSAFDHVSWSADHRPSEAVTTATIFSKRWPICRTVWKLRKLFFFCSFKHANDLVCHLECKIEYWHKNTVDAHRKWRNDDLGEWSSQHYSGGKNKNLWWTKAKVCKWHTKTNNRKNSAGIRRRHLFGSITFKWHELRRTPITFYNVTMIRIWPEMNGKINYLPSWRRQPTIVPSALRTWNAP